MSLAPLLEAPIIVQIHALAAAAALILGTVQLAAPKGGAAHKAVGAVWLLLMGAIAASSVFIGRPLQAGEPFWARFSPIHIFTVFTFVSLAIGLRLLLAGGPRLKHHSRPFIGLFVGGLIVAGGLALFPGRLMHEVVFGL